MPTLAELIDPMPGKIAVQVRVAEEITKSGLFLPESARSIHDAKAVQGVVVAIGDMETEDIIVDHWHCVNCDKHMDTVGAARRHEEDEPGHEIEEIYLDTRKYRLGSIVVFGKYSGTELSYQPPSEEGQPRPPKEKIVILMEKDILAIIRNPEEAANIKVKG